MPVNLDVSSDEIERLGIKPGARIVLRDPRDEASLAIITGTNSRSILSRSILTHGVVEDIYTPDKVKEAVSVFGADDSAHPAVAYLHNRVKDRYVGGNLQAIQPPVYFDYVSLRCRLSYSLVCRAYSSSL